jgi:6-phosphogluconate dehydrogenase, C-terminal domain
MATRSELVAGLGCCRACLGMIRCNAQGDLDSFLIEITSLILPKKDDKGDGFLVDKILDKTGMKGTGAAQRQVTYCTAVQRQLTPTAFLRKVQQAAEHVPLLVAQASGRCSRQRSWQWRRPPLRLHWMAASCQA